MNKRNVFDTCIPPILCYGVGNWTMTSNNMNKLRITQPAIERALLGIILKLSKGQRSKSGPMLDMTRDGANKWYRKNINLATLCL